MLDLDRLDLEGIATALVDQTDYEHRWLIDPLPSHVWFQDMADFAAGISDDSVGQQLARALEGRGVFRRFKTQIHQRHPELISPWHALRDRRAERRAVEWLLEQALIDEGTAQHFATDHPDPDLP